MLLCCFYVWIVCFAGWCLFWLNVSCLGIVCGCFCVDLKLVFGYFDLSRCCIVCVEFVCFLDLWNSCGFVVILLLV